MIHRRHPMRREQFREQPHHHLAVLEHVGHARRHAQIVLEHAKFPGIVTHDVDARDVRIDPARHIHALHFRPVLRIAQHLLGRNDAGLQDLLVVVDVVNEGIQRPHTLFQAAVEADPLFQREHPRHDVEGNEPF